jgi:O-antigen/teichoic acid export membrane protein
MRFAAAFRVSKNTGALLAGTMLRMVFAFAFVVFAARFLGVEGYGKFALTQHLFELSLSLSATGLGILVTREVARDRNWLDRHLAPAAVFALLLGVSAAGLLVIGATFAGYAPDTQRAICVAAIAVIPAALCALLEAIFVAFEKAELVAVGTALEGLVRIALCFAALLLGYELVSLFVILIVTRVAQLALYSLFLACRLPRIQWRFQTGELWSLSRTWLVFAGETWVATLYLSLDVVLLSLFWGEFAVGLYDAAWKLIRLGAVVANSFTTAVFPYISRLYVDARDTFHQLSQQSVKYILVMVVPAALCISVFAEPLVLFLFDGRYAESAPVLRVIAWMLIPQFLNPFLSRVLYARGQQGRSLAVSIVGLVVFVAVAFVLIPKFGAIGTAWTAVLSSYAALVCYLTFSTTGTHRRSIMMILLRQAAAILGLCLALFVVQHTQLVLALAACAVLYAGMLLGLRIVTLSDFKLMQELR